MIYSFATDCITVLTVFYSVGIRGLVEGKG